MVPDDAEKQVLERELADALVERQLLDAAPDALIVVSPKGAIVLVNAQAERLFGYSRPELLGQQLELLVPERVHGTHQAHLERYFAGPTPRPMGSGLQLFGRRKDGTELPVEVSLSPVQTARGTLVCAAVRDVTSRRRVEIESKLNADRLASAVESIEDALALYDAAGKLVLCNSAYRALVASSMPGALIGASLDHIVDAWLPALEIESEEERERFRARRAYGKGESRVSFDVRSRDGRSLRVMNRRTVEGGLVQTIWDLTSDMQRERELRDARAAAEAASSAKSAFLSSMSHELRTPLNSILGFAQLLQRDKKEPPSERHRERIEHILKSGEHLLHLIDEVLDLSRIESGGVPMSPEPVVVADVLAEVKTTLDPMAQRAGIDLVLDPVPAHLPDVSVDRTRFRQILLNFGSNAIKYGREGGHAVLRASNPHGWVRIAVSDDGPGIALEKQDRIFQPFYRAGQETSAIEGTGIGLALTKRLAELMGGRVGFGSTVGVGSEFWIELPMLRDSMRPQPPERGPQAEAGAALNGAGGRRFLAVYIEDNPSNIAFMEDLLADFDRVELITAPTAEIGIELVRARRPDVVIMDVNLPGISGLEATRRLRDWPDTASIPVIGLSAAATERDVERAREIGFAHYLTKPVDVDKLARILEQLLLR